MLVVLILAVLFVFWVLNLPTFGNKPKSSRLMRIKNLGNYKDGEIKNQSFTPMKPEDVSYWQMISKFIAGNKNGVPHHPILPDKPDFKNSDQLKITWFGHSSYLIQTEGINILVDPVFSQRTSPFQFIGTKNFAGTDFIKINELPKIDIVLITHDHYDHLDYLSILKLKDKTSFFVTSLGVGAHLERWGIETKKINELAWDEEFSALGLSFTATPARHFSGRSFKRNQTLWSSFILKTKNNNLYLGGDSGYDKHFEEIGKEYGPFDLAILECGQYNEMWPHIHMFPEQVLQAATDLQATALLPIHWGKFKLALHNWDEPIKQLMSKANETPLSVLTPRLGQTFTLEEKPKTNWWINYG